MRTVSGFFTQIKLFGLNSTALGYILSIIVLIVGFLVANSGSKQK